MSLENLNWENIIAVVVFAGTLIMMAVGEGICRLILWYRSRRNER